MLLNVMPNSLPWWAIAGRPRAMGCRPYGGGETAQSSVEELHGRGP
jgi:hypothetical protein